MPETRLPYDSVFLVGRFITAMARAVTEAGGVPNQFVGDGVFALFGLRRDPASACNAVLEAVARIEAALALLNAEMAEQAGQPIRAGVGVHCGPAIVGEIGFGRHVTTTALGDVVNTAARLQSMTREFECRAIVSDAVFARAGMTPRGIAREVSLRGRAAPLAVHLVDEAVTTPM